MKQIKFRSLDDSSTIKKFNILFVLLAVIPVALLAFLYAQINEDGRIDITPDQLSIAILFVVMGIISGYIAMRMMLKNLIDITSTSAAKMRDILGPERIQDFLKGTENEIVSLTRTFKEITVRLEENVTNLEMTKKTLHAVLTRVGQGIASLRDIDTFLDLIVETMTQALAGKKGMLLLLDETKKVLTLKAAHGLAPHELDKKTFSAETGTFTSVLQARTAMVIPKIQYLKGDVQQQDPFDHPLICAPLMLHDEVLGIMVVSGRKVDAPFQEEEMILLLNLATQTAVAIENSKLSSNADKTYFETLSALAMAVEAKDTYSRGHLDRVGSYCVSIAQRMRLDPRTIVDLRDAAKIHDVGKIGVTDDVLVKPGPLNEQEWVMMKRHPEIGDGIIKPISSLASLRDLVRHHHEKLDGSGYPDGLKGDQISLPVRILAIADIYDALTTDRPYRKAVSSADALGMMRGMGASIDQSVVNALDETLSKN